MRKDKEYIFKLRQEGKSYREIQAATGVSRATLSKWFQFISWSKHLSEEHKNRNLGASKERMERMGMVRRLSLQYEYARIQSEAAKEYQVYRKEPLFWAGLMLYAGEGDKRSSGLIRISNTDFYIHRIFIDFVKKYLKIKDESVKHALLLYPEHSETVCKEAWIKQLAAESRTFHKTQVIKGREKEKRLQYGVGMSIISSTSLKKKLLTWLVLAEKETFETNAAMV